MERDRESAAPPLRRVVPSLRRGTDSLSQERWGVGHGPAVPPISRRRPVGRVSEQKYVVVRRDEIATFETLRDRSPRHRESLSCGIGASLNDKAGVDRRSRGSTRGDRRSADRRGPPPQSWTIRSFVFVTPSATGAEERPRH